MSETPSSSPNSGKDLHAVLLQIARELNVSPTGPLVTVSEVAQLLGVSIDTVRRWSAKGVLKAVRDPKTNNRLFFKESIERLKETMPLTISEAAQALGISVSTLRRLEKKGLIAPEHGEKGERLYTQTVLEAYKNRPVEVFATVSAESVPAAPEAPVLAAVPVEAPVQAPVEVPVTVTPVPVPVPQTGLLSPLPVPAKMPVGVIRPYMVATTAMAATPLPRKNSPARGRGMWAAAGVVLVIFVTLFTRAMSAQNAFSATHQPRVAGVSTTIIDTAANNPSLVVLAGIAAVVLVLLASLQRFFKLGGKWSGLTSLFAPHVGIAFAEHAATTTEGEVLMPYQTYKKLHRRIRRSLVTFFVLLLLTLIGLKALPVVTSILLAPLFAVCAIILAVAASGWFKLVPAGQRLSTLKTFFLTDPRVIFARFAPTTKNGELLVGYATYKRLVRLTSVSFAVLFLGLVGTLLSQIYTAQQSSYDNYAAVALQVDAVRQAAEHGQGNTKDELAKLLAQVLQPAPGVDQNSLAQRIVDQLSKNLPTAPTQIATNGAKTIQHTSINDFTKQEVAFGNNSTLVYQTSDGTGFFTFGPGATATVEEGATFNIKGFFQLHGQLVTATAGDLNAIAQNHADTVAALAAVNSTVNTKANADVAFLVVKTDPSLPNERALAAGNGLVLTDRGAGHNLEVAIGPSVVTLNGDQTLINKSINGHFNDIRNVSLENSITDVLQPNHGGTGSELHPVAGGIAYFDATSMQILGPGSVGKALVSHGSESPGWETLGLTGGGTGATGFTAGSIVYSDGTELTQSNSKLFFDALAGHLGLGTNVPQGLLDLRQGSNGTTILYAQRSTDVASSGDFITYLAADGSTLYRVDNGGNVTASGSITGGSQTITSTSTPQLRLQYDGANEISSSTNSTGSTTLAFNGTSPHGIFIPQSNSTNTFQFQNASGNSVLTIDTANNRIGVNNTSPSFALDVTGSARFTSNVGIGTTTPASFLLDVNGTARISNSAYLAVNATGNVGIGTTSTNGKLDLRQTVNGETILYAQRATDVAPSGDFITYKNAAGVALFRVDNGGNLFAAGTVSGTSQTITSTTQPQLRIQYDGSNELAVSVNSTGGSTLSFSGSANQGIFLPQNNSTTAFQFQNAAQGSILNIDSTNNRIGINTTTPGYDLDVNGTIHGTAVIGAITPTGFTEGSVVFAGPGGTLAQSNGQFFWDNTNKYFGIGTSTPGYSLDVAGSVQTTGTTNLATASGNVGVGNTNPGAKLDVTGTGRFSSGLTATNGFTLAAGGLNLTASSGLVALTLNSSTVAFNVNNIFTVDTANSRVGVNNTAPLYSLDTTGTVRATAGGVFQGNVGIGTTAPTAQLETTGSVNLATAGGSVGIGTTTPGFTLDVVGTTHTAGLVATSGVTFSGFSTNGGLLYTNASGVLFQTGAGTSSTILHGGPTPAYGPVALTTDISGILPLANGGTASNLSATGGTSQVLRQSAVGAPVTVGQLAASDLSNGTTGSGAVALATSPVFVTPTLGAATATTINKVTITTPATGSTLTIADGKTLTVSNSLAFTGVDSSSVNFGSGGTVIYTSNKLSDLASTTSAELASVISNETGSGLLVFNNAPTLAGTLTFSGYTTDGGVLYTNTSGTVSQTGAGTSTTILHGGTTPSYSAVSLTADVTGILPLANGGTASNLSATGGTSQVLRQSTSGGAVTVGQLAASDLSNGTTGSGAVVLTSAPTITNAVLANINPGANFTITQNSVTPFVSVNAGAVANTLYLTGGNVGVGVTNPNARLQVRTASDGQNALAITNGGSSDKTWLFYPSGNDLRIWEWSAGYTGGGTDRVTFQTGGNVGLGTTNPIFGLQVVGSVGLATTSGNVGIGTTTPSSFKLEVAGNIGPDADNTRDIGSATRRYANVYATTINGTVTPTGFTQGSVAFAGSGGTLTQDNANFFYDATNHRLGLGNTSPTYRLDVTGTVRATAGGIFQGNVGIGTTAPVALVNVVDSVGTPATADNAFRIETTAGTVGPSMRFKAAEGADFLVTATGSGNTGGAGAFRIYDFNLGRNRIWFAQAGNTGINTDGPDRMFDILDASNPQLRLTQADGTKYTDFQTTSGGNLAIIPSGGNVGVGTTAPTFQFQATGSVGLATSTGNVGIGTALPAYKLDITGTERNTAGALLATSSGGVGIGNTAPQYSLDVTGTIAATGLRSSGTLIFSGFSTNGGILYTNASGVVAQSGAGSATTILHGGTIPTYSAVSLTADVSGTLPVGNGGTGTGTTFTQGSIVFAGASGVYSQDNAGFFYDATNHRIGIGSTTPLYQLDVVGSARTTGTTNLATTSGSVGVGNTAPAFKLDVTGTIRSTADGLFAGNVGVGNTTPAFAVDVTGTTRSTLGFSAGSSSQFQVDSNGNITKINNVAYSFPGSQATGVRVLQNDGAGNLTWASAGSTLAIGSTVTGGTTGSILYVDGTGNLAQDNANFFWDSITHRLGIGNTAPQYAVDVTGTIRSTAGGVFQGNVGIGTATPAYELDVVGSARTSGSAYLAVQGGNVGIGNSAPGFKLDVTGTIAATGLRSSGTLIFSGFSTNGGILYTNASGVVAQSGAGTSTTILHGGTIPTYSAVSLTADVSGTLPVGNGGTGTATTFTQGSLVFAGASGIYSQDNANIFYDAATHRLGLGTTTPGYQLQTTGSVVLGGNVGIGAATSPSYTLDVTGTVRATAGGIFQGNVGIGNTAPQYGLDVTGTVAATGIRSSGTLIFSGFSTNGGILYTNASGVVAQSGAGTSTTILHGGTIPTYSAISLTADVSGTLPVGSGGTGTATTFTQGSIVFAGASGVYSQDNAGFFYDATNHRLGLGSTTPSYQLDVAGSARTTGVTNLATVSGNVGVGNTAPVFKLDVTGTIRSTTDGIFQGNVGVGNTAPVFALDVTGTARTTGSAYLATAGGSVGVGTTAPSSLFSVGSSSQFQVNSSGQIAAAAGITSSGTITFSGFNTNGGVLYTNGSGQLAQTAAGSSTTILHGGTTPSYSAVSLTADVSGTLPVGNGGTGTATTFTQGSLVFAGASGVYSQDNANIFYDAATHRLGLGTTTPGFQLQLTGSAVIGGNVGIGATTSPSYTLDVTGTARTTQSTYLATAGGSVGVGNTAPSSLFSVGSSSQFQVNSSGQIAAAAGITSSGTITFSGFNTNGGVLYTNGSGQLAQTAAGSSTTILHGGTTPSYSAISLTADVSGTLPVTSGGTGTGTAFTQGSLVFAGASGVYSQDNANIFYDAANHRLGLGTTTPGFQLQLTGSAVFGGNVGIGNANPTQLLEVGSSANAAQIAQLTNTSTGTGAYTEISLRNDNASQTGLRLVATGTGFVTSAPFAQDSGTLSADTALSGGLSIAARNAAGVIRFYTGGDTEHARFDATGNLGLGTTAPSSLFSVGSSSQFQVNSSGQIAAAAGITSSGTITFSGFNTNGGVLYTNGSGQLAQTAAGSATTILHGGTTPSYSAISLTADVTGVLPVTNGGTGANTLTGVLIGNGTSPVTGSTTSSGISGALSDETGSGLLVFNSAPTITNPVIANINPGADFTITQNSVTPFVSINSGAVANTLTLKAGNVGIGTTNPGYPLDIQNAGFYAAHFQNTTANASQTSFYMENDRGSFASYGGFLYGSSTGNIGNLFGQPRTDRLFMFADGASNLGMYIGTLSAQPFVIGTNNIERVRVDSAGNVGIGTSAPTFGLQATGSVGLATSGTGNVGIGAATVPAYKLDVTGTIRSTTGALLATSSGGVGIGNTAPQYALDVTGTVASTGLRSSGTIIFSGFSTNGGILYTNASGIVAQSGAGSATTILHGGTIPTYSAVSLTADVSGTLPVGNGGTGTGTTFTQGSIVFAGASGVYSQDNSGFFYDATNHRLGLGSTTPSYQLDVVGSARTTGTTNLATVSGNVGVGNTTPVFKLDVTGTIRSTADGLFAGNVGIGNTAPSYALDVTGTTRSTLGFFAGSGSQFQIDSTGNITKINNVAYSFPSAQASGTRVLQNDGAGNLTWASAGSSLAIGSSVGSGTSGSVLFIDGSGNLAQDNTGFFYSSTTHRLGLGTTTPGYQLQTTGSAVIGGNVGVGATTSPSFALDVTGTIRSTTGGIFQGNVGIGTATPAYELDVVGSARTSGSAYLAVQGGSVGIGNTTPGFKLDVTGTVAATGLRSSGTIIFSGFSTNGGILYTNASGIVAQSGAGTSTTILHGGTIPTYSAVSLTADVSGTLPVGNGGTGTATTFTQGSLVFAGASGVYSQDNANIFYDATNHRLGLGNTTPAYQLDVTGSARTTGTTNLATAGGNVGVGTTTPAGLFDVNGKLTVLSNGNVGIGTTGPTLPLSVVGGASGNAMAVIQNVNIDGYSAFNMSDYLGTAQTAFGYGNPSAANAAVAGKAYFFTASGTDFVMLNNTTPNVTFKANGNVGIGTTAPSSLFSVGSSSQFQVNSSGQIAAAAGITSSGTITFSGFSTNGGVLYTNASGVLAQTAAGSTTTILHGGTTPSYSAVSLTADVSGTLPVANGGTGTGTAFTQGSLVFAGASGVYSQDNANIFYDAATHRLGLGTTTPGFQLQLTGSAVFGGNVGIGTTTPSQLLEVGGSVNSAQIAQITNTSTGTGAYAEFALRNDSASQTGLRLVTTGANFVASAPFSQDSGTLSADTALSGGLTIAARNTAGGVIRFYSGGDTERARFDIAGNFGLGTTAPVFQLQATGSASFAATTGNVGIGNTAPVYKLDITGTERNTAGALLATSSGGVGIGNTAPQYALDVTGTVAATGIRSSGTLIFSGFSTNGGILYTNASGVVAQSGAGSATTILHGGTIPTYSAVSLTADVSGTLPVGNGGTGTGTTFTQGSIVFAGASGVYTQDNSGFFYDATNHRLGLGSTTPSYQLDVVGSARTTGTTNLATVSGNVGVGNTAPVFKLDVTGTIRSTADGLFAGNVGIGNTAPVFALDVTGTTRSTLGFFAGSSSQFQIDSTGNITKINNVAYSFPSSQASGTKILQNDGSGNLTWASAGSSLAIGSSVTGATSGSVLFVDGSGNLAQDNTGFFYSATTHRLGLGTTTPGYQLQTTGSAVLGGNVGIGATTSPSYALDVTGTIRSTTGALLATSSGGVGIGNTAPQYALDVTGTIAGTGLRSSGTIIFSGFSTNGGILYTNASGVVAQSGAGTSTTVLHGGTIPTYSAVSLTADVSGTLPVGNGGTGTATTFTQGSIVFAGASGVYSQDNANIFYDAATHRLGLGTTTPGFQLALTGSAVIGGNVGVGATTAPSYALDVTGTGRFTAGGLFQGNVGIGTTTPSQLLEVGSSANAAQIAQITNTSTGTGAYAEFALRNDSASQTGLRLVATGTGFVTSAPFTQDSGTLSADTALSGGLSIAARNTAGGVIRFYSGGDTERARFDINGNLGLGTTVPVFQLQTTGSAVFGGNVGIGNTAPQYALDVTGTIAATGLRSTGTTLLATTGGNVGIGTTSPGSTLEVNTSGAASSVAIVGNSSTAGSAFNLSDSLTAGNIYSSFLNPSGTSGANLNTIPLSVTFSTGSNTSGGIYFVSKSASAPIVFAAGGNALANERLRITSAGNVGIGNTAPVFKLDVTGTVRATAGGVFQGNVGIGTTVPTSALHIDNGAGVVSGDKSLIKLSAAGSDSNGGGSTATATIGFGNGPDSVGGTSSGASLFFSANYLDSQPGTVSNYVFEGQSAAQQITFNSGAVGIGLTTTANKLDVKGAVAIGSYAGTSTAPSNGLIVSGNVGIGTTAPSSIFSVGSSSQFQVNSSGQIAAAAGITSSGTITFSGFSTNGGVLYTNGSGQLAQTAAGSSTTILHGGTTPSYSAVSLTADVSGTLPVGNGGTGTATTFTQGSVVFAGASGVYSQDNTTLFFDATNHRLGLGTTTPVFQLQATGSAVFGGNVGIGATTSPSFALDVTGTARTTQSAYLATASGNVGIGNTTPSYKLDITGTERNTAGALLATSSGGVGIGNTAPQYALDVTGTIAGTGLRSSGTLIFSGFSTNGGLLYTNASGIVAQTAAGSSTTILHGGTVPSYSAVSLTADVSGTLPVGNGGTGTATTFTQGSVVFAGASGVYSQDNGNLFYDGTNHRLGLGTTTPTFALQVTTSVGLATTSGNVGIGTTNPTTKFQVNTGSLASDTGALFYENGSTITNAGKVNNGEATLAIQNHDATHAALAIINDVAGSTTVTSGLGTLLEFDNRDTSNTFQGSNVLLGYGGFAFTNTASFAAIPNGVAPSFYGVNSTSGTLGFNQSYTDETANTDILTFTLAGKVGIGTTAPSTQFQTTGSVGLATTAGNVGVGTTTPVFQLQVAGSTGLVGNVGIGATTVPVYKLDVTGTIRSTTGALLATSSGGVGIGNTAPQYALDVTGTIAATGLRSSGTLIFSGFSTNGGLLYTNASGIVAQTAAGSSTTILHGGTTPSYSAISLTADVSGTLPVGNGGTGTATTFTQGSVVFAGASGVYSQDNGNIFYDGTNHRLGLGTTTPSFQFQTTGTAVLATTSGNVGIGTTAPIAKLDVNGDIHIGNGVADDNNQYNISTSGQLSISANSAASQDNSFDGLTLGAGSGANSSGIEIYGSASDSFRQITFSTLGTERVRIDKNGNLGIGTTAPVFQLQSTGTTVLATTSGNVGIGTTAPGATLDTSNYFRVLGSAGASVGVPTSGKGVEITYDATGDTGFLFSYNRATSAYKALKIDGSSLLLNSASSGNVGIGTTAPVFQLQTTGSAVFGGNVGIGATTSPSFALDVTGTTRSTLGFFAGSSSQFQINSAGNITKINNVAYSFPSSQASGTKILQNDGSGNLTWASAGSSLAIGSAVTSGTSGSVLFVDASGNLAQDNTGFLYDSTTHRLGLGTTTPSFQLAVTGSAVFGGNVGIGATTSPSFALDVTGTARTTNGALIGTTAGKGLGIGTTTPAYELDVVGSARTSGSAYLAVQGGNVGIGNSAPSFKLDVTGTLRSTTGAIFQGVVGVGTTTPGSVSSAFFIARGQTADTLAGAAEFINSSNGSLLYARNDGTIGIGTTSSTTLGTAGQVAKLVVVGATEQSGAAGIKILNSSSAGGGVLGLNIANTSSGSTTQGYNYGIFTGITSTGSGGITDARNIDILSPAVSGGGTVATAYGLYINDQKTTGVTTGYGIYQPGTSDLNYFAGNVGIGTTTPSDKLHLEGSSAGARLELLRLSNTGGSAGAAASLGFSYSADTVSPAFISAPYDGSFGAALQFATGGGGILGNANGTVQMTILGNGNVGIGNTAPSYKLDVTGTVRATTGAIFQGNVGIGTTVPNFQLHTTGAAVLATTTGNVGIGTTSTSYLLDVAGTARTTASTYLATAGGNVGIGITNPGALFDVNGLFQVNSSGSIAAVAGITSSNTVTIGSGGNTFTLNPASGPSYAGTARPTRKVTLSPEFPGATLTADGANNTGTMTSDFCEQGASTDIPDTNTTVCNTAGDVHNYYNWVTDQGTAQDYDIWVRYRVPDNFSGWAASNPVKVYAKRPDTTGNSVKLYIYDTAGTVETNANATEMAGAANWTQTSVSSLSGTYTPGSYMTIRIHMTADSDADAVQVGEINMDYLSNN